MRVAVAFVLVLFVVPALCQAAGPDFSGTLKLIEGDKTIERSFCLKGDRYRMEGEEDGNRFVAITDRAKDQTTFIKLKEETYMVLKSYSAAMRDPLKGFSITAENLDKGEPVQEKLGDYECSLTTYTHSQMKEYYLKVWHATKLDFAIKQEMQQRKMRPKKEIVIDNIVLGPVDETLMSVPEGFTRELTREEIEATLPWSTKREELQAAVGRRLGAGAELHVKVDPQRPVRIDARSGVAEETVVLVEPFKDGKKKENIGVEPWKFSRKGEGRNRTYNDNLKMFGKTFQIDEVRVKVEKGKANLSVIQRGKVVQDTYQQGGTGNWYGVPEEKTLILTLTGDSQFGPTSTVNMKLKKESGEENTTFSLENGKSRTWTFAPADGVKNFTLKIDLGKGGVKVHRETK